ncbi:Protein export cytoplasm protein SecA ATPase RNA helicase [Desulfosporosinus sp. I2]|nr:Protein export cytoplasm protein SecA ATPase RNA helicase [Desulfosporosinus sp. I2]
MKESVSYSQRTADRLMQLCEEYGTKLLASSDSDGHPDSSLVTNLTYTPGAHPPWDPGRETATTWS